MVLHNHHHLSVIFGILGNAVSFCVYLAPLPTFIRIFKKKSTEGFHSVPYSVALFSAMSVLYYALIKKKAFLLITINSFGCLIESLYLSIFLVYATHSSRMFTIKLVLLFNLGAYIAIVLSTFLLTEGSERVHVVGWINTVFSVGVFAAPLTIIRQVIKTKSVEFMPFWLSFTLTVSAACWLAYGLLIKDYFVAVPNIPGIAFGFAQMVLYLVYKKRKNEVLPENDDADGGDDLKDNPQISNSNNVDQVHNTVIICVDEEIIAPGQSAVELS